MTVDADPSIVDVVERADDRVDLDLFREFRASGSRRIRNQIVERHMGLAGHIARRYGQATSAEDVRQVAMLGLVKAVDRFDPDHGAAFGSFAGLTIEGEIKRHFRDRTWTVRVPRSAKELHLLVRDERERLQQQLGRSPRVEEIATRLGIEREDVLRGMAASAAYQMGSLDTTTADDDDAGDHRIELAMVEPGFAATERRELVELALEILPERERRIVELRFYGGKSQREIADIVGVSQMHVSRLLRSSYEQMRSHLQGAGTEARTG